MAALLSLRDVRLAIGSTRAVDGISLDIEAGSTTAILGPSGSGKTSLLRLCAGLERLDGGSIRLGDVLASSPGHNDLPPERRGLAMTFQYPALLPHLDVLHNTVLGLPGDPAEVDRAGRRGLEDVGLAGFERRRVWQLSGGEAQRVALARALVRDATLLLLDEPFANVDRLARSELVARLAPRLTRGGSARSAVVLVTHDPADALELADRTVVLRDRRVVADGAIADIAAGTFGEWPAHFINAGLRGERPRAALAPTREAIP